MKPHEFKTVEIECPKCAHRASYRIKYERVVKGGERVLVLSRRVHCKVCRAMVNEVEEIPDKKHEISKDKIIKVFDYAKKLIAVHGYKDQVVWLEDLLKKQIYKTVSMRDFFVEYVWVVLVSGFKADVVRKHWPSVKTVLKDFDIAYVRGVGYDALLDQMPIKNKAKVKALANGSQMITEEWLKTVRESTSWYEIKEKLSKLPFIGKITVYHIMRNLGVDCFKPDRHIENLANELDVEMSEIFDEIVGAKLQDYIGSADFILWRSCATLGSAKELVDRALNGRTIPAPPKKNKKITDYLF